MLLKELSVINFKDVPRGMDDETVHIRNVYTDYFRKQNGYFARNTNA